MGFHSKSHNRGIVEERLLSTFAALNDTVKVGIHYYVMCKILLTIIFKNTFVFVFRRVFTSPDL